VLELEVELLDAESEHAGRGVNCRLVSCDGDTQMQGNILIFTANEWTRHDCSLLSL